MHGSGCNCPACAGAAKITTQATPEVRWALPGWALAGAAGSPEHKKTDAANPPPAVGADAPPATDAFFANQTTTDVLPVNRHAEAPWLSP
jgi:hypothetical protein